MYNLDRFLLQFYIYRINEFMVEINYQLETCNEL